MQFSYAVITALLTSVASSQSVADLVSQIPSCALTCLATAATANGCGISNYACQCGPVKDAIVASATPCVLSKCSSSDTPKVLTVSNEICNLAVPVASSGTSAGGAATTPVGSFASAIPSLTSKPTSSSSSSSAATSVSTLPVLVSSNAGSKMHAGAIVAGVGFLAAFGL